LTVQLRPGFATLRRGYLGRDMMTQPALTQHPDRPRTDPPMPHARPRGFLDCRGEWQAIDEDGDRDAAA
jgi:hypothetical protein